MAINPKANPNNEPPRAPRLRTTPVVKEHAKKETPERRYDGKHRSDGKSS